MIQPEQVNALLGATDEVESTVRAKLLKPTLAHFNPFVSLMNTSILNLRRDRSTRFGLTLEQEHLLVDRSASEAKKPPLAQIDVNSGVVMSVPSPKYIIVARRVGAQACVDGRLEKADSSAPGRQYSISARGGGEWGESHLSRVVIDKYKGKYGPYSEGTRVTYEYDHNRLVNGGIQIDLTPDLEPLSVITRTISSPLPPIIESQWQRDEWFDDEGPMPDDISRIVGATVANILFLTYRTQEIQ